MVPLTIHTRATSIMIHSSFACRISMPIISASQMAWLANGRTPLTVISEIHCEVMRGENTFQLDGLVVANELDSDMWLALHSRKQMTLAPILQKTQLLSKARTLCIYGSQIHALSAMARCVQTFLCQGSVNNAWIPNTSQTWHHIGPWAMNVLSC